MANFNAVSRTNYFEVKDRAAFIAELDKLSFEDMEVFDSQHNPNKIALGGYSDITVVYDEEKDELVEVFELIQKHIKEDDACIFLLAGYEKLRYVVADALVVTADKFKYISARDLALKEAAKMLGIKAFDTCMDY